MNTPTRSAPTPSVTALTDAAAQAAITVACRTLFLPTIRTQAAPMAEAAARERLTHQAYLAEVLAAECDDREARRRDRRVKEAKFPRTKRLEDFDTTAVTDLPPATLAHLATGAWIDAGQPLVLLGDSGTGKTHLLIGLGTAAAEQGRRVRYVTTAAQPPNPRPPRRAPTNTPRVGPNQSIKVGPNGVVILTRRGRGCPPGPSTNA